MATTRIAITIDAGLLRDLDRMVRQEQFRSRSLAIQEAVGDKLARMNRSRLTRECAKLDRRFEKQLADEGLARDLLEWPEY